MVGLVTNTLAAIHTTRAVGVCRTCDVPANVNSALTAIPFQAVGAGAFVAADAFVAVTSVQTGGGGAVEQGLKRKFQFY